MLKKIYLLTKNLGKLKAANSVFNKYNIELQPIEKEFPEIQADTSLEIARYSAIQAAKELGVPVVREDHSLFIDTLGIPGPYINYVEKKISTELLTKILNILQDNKGKFVVATVYAEPNGETFEYSFEVPMTFGSEVKGDDARGWNGLIRLQDESRAITEYPEEERLHIWNQGYEAVAKHISSKN